MDEEEFDSLFTESDHPSVVVSGAEHAEGWMDKEEITALAETFFAKEGFPLGDTRKLSISFVDFAPYKEDEEPDYKTAGTARYTMGTTRYHRARDAGLVIGDVALFIPNVERSGYVQFINTLYHELTHVLQRFRGTEFDYSMKYELRPHEIEARRNAKVWTKKMTGFSSVKEVFDIIYDLDIEAFELAKKAASTTNRILALFGIKRAEKILEERKRKISVSRKLLKLVQPIIVP